MKGMPHGFSMEWRSAANVRALSAYTEKQDNRCRKNALGVHGLRVSALLQCVDEQDVMLGKGQRR